jgi:hypothetical protein
MDINAAGQIVVHNPARPSGKDAGRSILLEELFRIRDDANKIIFKGPVQLAFSEDGSLYFLAYDHLFKFNQEGQFVFRAIEEGEGPRESNDASRFFFMGRRIRVLSFAPPKVLDYDDSGRYLKEAKIRMPKRMYFLSTIENKIYGIQDELAYSDDIGKEGLVESPFRLYEISEDFQILKKIYDFPVRHYVKKAHWFRTTNVDWATSSHYLFALHTPGYRIAKLDLNSGILERIITRSYTSPRHENQIKEKMCQTPNSGTFLCRKLNIPLIFSAS